MLESSILVNLGPGGWAVAVVAVRWPSLTDALKPLRLADCQCDIPFSASQVQQIQTWFCEISQFGCANGFAKHCSRI